MSDAEVERWIRTHYGYLIAMRSNAEVWGILTKAAKEGLTVEALYGLLTATQWWRTTEADARQWDMLVREDPATAEAKRGDKAAEITNIVATLGLGDVFYPEAVKWFADQALKFGWTPEVLADQLVNWGGQGDTFTQGELAAWQTDAKKLAAEYFMPVSDEAAADWARRMAKGEVTADGIRAYYANQAKQQFANQPDLLGLIDQGITLKDYFDPHRQTIANLLEVSPDSIDFTNDTRWRQVLGARQKDGSLRPMSLTEVGVYARQQPAYSRTAGARQQAAGAASAIAQLVGLK